MYIQQVDIFKLGTEYRHLDFQVLLRVGCVVVLGVGLVVAPERFQGSSWRKAGVNILSVLSINLKILENGGW